MGRVNTLAMACAWALLPFGGLVGGLLVTAVGRLSEPRVPEIPELGTTP